MRNKNDNNIAKKLVESIVNRNEIYKMILVSNKRFDEKFIFRGSFFVNPSFEDCSFYGSIFKGGDCERIKFLHCQFKNCKFEGGNFIESSFIKCTFKNCSILRGNYHKADFQNSIFINTEIKMVNLRKTNFSNTLLDKCVLAGNAGWANFQNGKMKDTNLSDCTMRYALVRNLKLTNCSLKITDLPYLLTPKINDLKNINYFHQKKEIDRFDISNLLITLINEYLKINDFNTASNISLILGEVKSAFYLLFRGLDYYLENNRLEDFYTSIKIYSISFQCYFPEIPVETLLQTVLLKKELSDARSYLTNEKYFLDVLDYLQLFNFKIDLNKCSLNYYKEISGTHISISFREKFSYSEFLFLLSPYLKQRIKNENQYFKKQFETIIYRGSEGIKLIEILLESLPGIITMLLFLIDKMKKRIEKKESQTAVTIIQPNIQLYDNRVQVYNKIEKIVVNKKDSPKPEILFPINSQ